MTHSHGTQNAHGTNRLSADLAKGIAVSTTVLTGKSLLSRIKQHPLLILGAGIVIGIYAHKYRKEIIASASTIADKGKDFVLQQKENLEDIIAEAKEGEPKV
jgi:hypothetical protein